MYSNNLSSKLIARRLSSKKPKLSKRISSERKNKPLKRELSTTLYKLKKRHRRSASSINMLVMIW
jgi:hypothetical protein